MTNFASTDLQWVMSLMAQDNAWPFAYSGGSNVTINWTGPKQAFASYWQNLLAAHEVNATTDVSATSFADLDKGIDATWLSSAWGPSYFAPDAKTSLGDWRAARCRSGPRALTSRRTGAARPTRSSRRASTPRRRPSSPSG